MAVAVIDYGSGNLRSAAKALERAAAESGLETEIQVTDAAGALDRAAHIVLPGVGAFGDCLEGLDSLPGMRAALEENVIGRGKPFLGICIGMQLMADGSCEHGEHRGLGWIKGRVAPIEPAGGDFKIPHMGWNELEFTGAGHPGHPEHPVLAGIEPGAHAYFVHGYGIRCEAEEDVLAEADYGGKLTAIVGRDNLIGTQFHPEKSQATGLKLLANFLAWRP